MMLIHNKPYTKYETRPQPNSKEIVKVVPCTSWGDRQTFWI